MAGFCEDEYGCFGSMTVGVADYPLNCPGWDFYGYQKLWAEFEVRTDEVTLPTAPGRRSYPGRLDQSEYELTVYINGEAGANGAPYADPWQGLYSNLQLLWNNVLSPVSTGRGTRPAELTCPWGDVLVADVKFEPLRAVDEIEDPTFAVYRTTIIVPAGRFEHVGS